MLIQFGLLTDKDFLIVDPLPLEVVGEAYYLDLSDFRIRDSFFFSVILADLESQSGSFFRYLIKHELVCIDDFFD